ncbi:MULTISPECIES: glycosyltransferase family 4 protein [Sphingomonas]|uniref:Glycosyltransferase family 4 protein n=1 Tax=Sphingomonas kyungheensis TaxID=1069987 RepID=A0ABU8H7T8_9SPHN|nr:glycosyltransferase family 4 protein [Sphingomonas sp. CV7422]
MRLLTASHFFTPHGGGIELVAGHLNRELAASGHDTQWAAAQEGTLPDLGATQPIGLACIDWLERLSGLPMPIPLPGAVRKLWRAVAASEAVIVHDALYASSILAVIAARRHRKPVLLIQHIADIPFSSPVLRGIMALANRAVTRPMLRAADQVVFISATVRDRFADARFRRPPRLVFNGVDTALFHPASPDARIALRVRYGFGDEQIMLFVGRFVAKKGLHVIAALARRRPDLRFVLVGRGPIDPCAWGLPNVTVIPQQPSSTLAGLYRAADLLLLPSVGEGFPLVVQEALASGLRVLCGTDTAHADPNARVWINHADIDLADPVGTAERVATAIDRLPAGAPPAEMAAQAARCYSWPGMAAAVAAAIGDLTP